MESSLCALCTNNKAELWVILPGLAGGNRAQLCLTCSRRLGMLPSRGMRSINERDLWEDSADSVLDPGPCHSCGTTWYAIDYSGLAGCPQCYEHFSQSIEHLYCRIALGSPRKALDWLNLLNLKNQLQTALDSEDFESAGRIRDQIAHFQGEIQR